MMFKIKCPQCETEGSFSLADSSYEGPYRCWKCRALFTIQIEDNQLKSMESLSQEEFEKQQELQALKDQFRR